MSPVISRDAFAYLQAVGTVKLPGSNVVEPRYDVIDLAKVLKAVYIQPHPSKEGAFFYNRNV